MCLLLNKHITAKHQQYASNTIDNKGSINTFIQMPDTKIEKKKNQDQTNRFKITETQRPLEGRTINTIPEKKKNQHTTSTKNTLVHNEQPNNLPLDANVLSDLLNTLISKQNSVKNNDKIKLNFIIKKNNNHDDITSNIIKNNEINVYKRMISESIQKKFYNASNYTGKKCDLRIKLAPDGTLLSITAISGDISLCQAAIIATKSAKMPKPPNTDVYEVFKNIILNFSPQ
ncbi:cell envelope integrity protein TolA [Candidatus Blochmannia vicinus (nom. nud.)]|uniref:cell envelope integrity protein TolA n=1 Tax=Candidatus Blochmannia vicinus (nom. nud.) TaxID=251540 RepID=UPI00202403A8|nr:cell envelope integrity protein TolA [Candidatus Blochmannia vicinus]URJ30312.1 cell envelope integrity protein TolA [Candidatus Blochmannia vicinus]